MPLDQLDDKLWDDIAARCPAAADRAALARCCRAGDEARRRALRCVALTPPELPTLAAAAAAGRLPKLERLVVGSWRGGLDAGQSSSLYAARSLSALTGLTELHALGTLIEGEPPLQQLAATLGVLPRLSALRLRVPACSGAIARALAGLTRLQRLELQCNDIEKSLRDADAAALAALTGLTSLALPGHELTSDGLDALLEGMTCLEELDISDNEGIRLGDAPAADALAALPRLRTLAARHGAFLGRGAAPLAQLTRLERVDLVLGWGLDGSDLVTGVRYAVDAVAEVARLPALQDAKLDGLVVGRGILDPLAAVAATRLRTLEVCGVADQAGFDSILRFTGLTSLRVSPRYEGFYYDDVGDGHNGGGDGDDAGPWLPGDAGAAKLARALTGLVDLELPERGIAAPGAAALAASLTRLTRLNLDSNLLGDEGAAALAGGRLHGLVELHCFNAGIGDAGAAAIAAGLTALTRLDLRDNPVGCAGAAALVRMRGLRYLGGVPGCRQSRP